MRKSTKRSHDFRYKYRPSYKDPYRYTTYRPELALEQYEKLGLTNSKALPADKNEQHQTRATGSLDTGLQAATGVCSETQTNQEHSDIRVAEREQNQTTGRQAANDDHPVDLLLATEDKVGE